MDGYIGDSLFTESRKKSNSLISPKMICKVLGVLLLVEMVMFLLCGIIAVLYKEKELYAFLECAGINGTIGCILIYFGKGSVHHLTKRDGYCIASFAWVLFSLFGMLPFYISGSVSTITNAFFETMSGFTTTGATIMDNIDSQSHAILFWRSLTQWIGGLGIVCFIIAVLPIFHEGNVQLFTAESIGVTHDKLHPKVSIMAKWIWFIYLFITAAEVLLLVLGGMDLFDAVCNSFSTTATGGFSTKQDSIAYWHSPYIEYVVSIFMIISGTNFSLYFLVMKGKFKRLFRDEEVHWFIVSILILTGIITFTLVHHRIYGLEEAFRKALFQVATSHTSCGFATDDYMRWPGFTWMLLMFAMLSGGCTGSTSGGIKNLRLLILSKSVRNVFKRMLHPNAILPIRIDKQTLSTQIITSVAIFIGLYLFVAFIGWTLLMMTGMGFLEAFGTTLSAMGNVGPGLGSCGPAYSWNAIPDASKWILSFLMLIGRLEMYCVLLLFYPGFWKSR